MKYSQNNEQNYIVDYFKNSYPSTFLDIGAYDGIDLSNTRALMELGWNGVCVEPNDTIFEKLKQNTKDFTGVECYKVAIGETNEEKTFYQNDTYYSTLSTGDMYKWAGAGMHFTESKIQVVTFETFLQQSKYKLFDFITIDAEGFDFAILKQMDLIDLGCKMICIEHNSENTQEYFSILKKYNMNIMHVNPENIIAAI